MVSTSRCGRDNPGSNPGHGRAVSLSRHDQSSFESNVTCLSLVMGVAKLTFVAMVLLISGRF